MGRELAVPFAVDPLGNIAFTSDPVQQLTDHVTVLIGTQLSERVMRPGYGVNTNAFLFADNDSATAAVLEENIRTSVATYEPNVTVSSVEFDQRPAEGYLGVRVGFRINNDETQAERVAVIQSNGTVVDTRV